uniref:Uncharacterized protein n=3 Tax=Leptocylindrus danicus TaxID=163516 RepID=A0A7S2PS88_9STRA|mmetsp:Transcript_9189/g.13763  ORF Transcript_9189/g.13763 Transcript_9189/m.13763 type:complete len:1770 (+) Transcript_9189:319-5628(+)
MKPGSSADFARSDDDEGSSSSSYSHCSECSRLSDKLEEIEFLKSQQLNVGNLFRSAASRVASARKGAVKLGAVALNNVAPDLAHKRPFGHLRDTKGEECEILKENSQHKNVALPHNAKKGKECHVYEDPEATHKRQTSQIAKQVKTNFALQKRLKENRAYLERLQTKQIEEEKRKKEKCRQLEAEAIQTEKKRLKSSQKYWDQKSIEFRNELSERVRLDNVQEPIESVNVELVCGEYQSGMFSHRKCIKQEVKRLKLMDQEAHVERIYGVYRNSVIDAKAIAHKISKLREKKIDNEAEVANIGSAIANLLESYRRPFLREANAQEVETMHVLKEKLSQQQKAVKLTEEDIKKLQQEQRDNAKHSIQVAKKIAVLKEDKRATRGDLDYEISTVSLPMIVGRHISCSIDPFFASPQETYEKITQRSDLAITKEKIENAVLLHRGSKSLHRKIREACQKRQDSEEKIECLERNRIKIENQIQSEDNITLVRDLNRAVKRFWDASDIVCHIPKINSMETAICKNEVITSNYVRDIRSEQMSWDRRRTKLLSELFEAKKSDAEYWDSGLFLGTSGVSSRRNKEERNLICTGSLSSMKTRNLQSVDSGISNGLFRYQREIFIDMVLDELLVNKKFSKKEDTVQMKRHLDPAHVTQSNTMYVARKQAKHEDALKKAKALEGCTLELLGDARVTVVVKMAQIVWVENGCLPNIMHSVQRIDTRNGLICGKEELLNLSSRPYFIADDGAATARKERERDYVCEVSANCCIPVSGRMRIDLDKIENQTWGIPRPNGSIAAVSRSHWGHIEEVCWSRSLRLQCYYEKERWEMKQDNAYFYDVETPSFLQRINVIHRLDWPRDSSEFREDMLLRIEDVKRKAAFHDFINFISRINCFKLKVHAMEEIRSGVYYQYMKIKETLSSLQETVAFADKSICDIGGDFHESSRRLDELRNTRLSASEAEENLAISRLLKVQTSQARQGVEVAAKVAEEEAVISRERLESAHQIIITETLKTDDLSKKLEILDEQYTAAIKDWNEAMEDRELIQIQRRGCIVHTNFGLGKVLSFREDDGFLCVSVKFGVPRQRQSSGIEARLYTHIEGCAVLQKQRRNVSRAQMQYEDKMSRLYTRNERIRSMDECKLMSNEDNHMREILTDVRIAEVEKKIINSYYNASLDRARSFLQCAEGRRESRMRVDTAFKKEEKDRLLKAKNWDGEGTRPVPLQIWEHVPLRQSLKTQVKAIFKHELIEEEMVNAGINLRNERMRRVSVQVANDIISLVIREITANLMKDAISADRKSRIEAEKSSGIIFIKDPHLSLNEYRMKVRAWGGRKNELQCTLESWALSNGLPPGTRPTSSQHQKDAEQWKEEKRQIECCERMFTEETLRRTADREEMKRSVRERKLMFADEQCTRLFLKQQEMLRKAAAIQQLSSTPTHRKTDPTEKERRRTQLKKNMAERQRIKREFDMVSQEDERARCLRAYRRKEEHMKLLEEEMKHDEECNDSLFANIILHETQSRNRISANESTIENVLAQWGKKWYHAIAIEASNELDMMEIDERLSACKKEVLQNQFNVFRMCCEISKVTRESMFKGKTSVELRVKSNARVAADNEAERAISDNERKLAERRCDVERVEKETKYMDSAVLTKVPQRWETKKLRDHLHQPFFNSLVEYIVISAEAKAVSNQLAKLALNLDKHDAAIKQKQQHMKALRNKNRRQQFMRMKRSGMRIFCRYRRKVIMRAIRVWRDFIKWKVGHKRLYELRYSGILRAMTSDCQGEKRRII